MKKKYNENYSPVGHMDVAAGGSSVAENRQIISVAEAASILGVSTKAIYALVRQPFTDFPSFKVGKRILISREMLYEWIRHECMKPSA